jgi:hypothetical protein
MIIDKKLFYALLAIFGYGLVDACDFEYDKCVTQYNISRDKSVRYQQWREEQKLPLSPKDKEWKSQSLQGLLDKCASDLADCRNWMSKH